MQPYAYAPVYVPNHFSLVPNCIYPHFTLHIFLSQKVLSLPTTYPEILFIRKAYFNHFVLWESSFVSPAWVWSLPFPLQLFSSSSILKLWDWVSISCFVVMLYRLNFHVSQIGRSAQNFFPLFSYYYLQPFCRLLISLIENFTGITKIQESTGNQVYFKCVTSSEFVPKSVYQNGIPEK